jgi:hypothetical protein
MRASVLATAIIVVALLDLDAGFFVGFCCGVFYTSLIAIYF